MMKPHFLRFLSALCEFYGNESWPTETNIDAAFRDVRSIPDDALEGIASHIRCNNRFWPKSLSAAMHTGYAAVEHDLAVARAKQAEPQPLTDEQMRQNHEAALRWLPKIRAMVATVRPAYTREASDEPGLRRQRGSR